MIPVDPFICSFRFVVSCYIQPRAGSLETGFDAISGNVYSRETHLGIYDFRPISKDPECFVK